MRLVTIAIAHRSSTAATAVCTLEAAGFDVFCPGFHFTNMVPQFALATGGIAVSVPDDQVPEALALLHSFSAPEQSAGIRSKSLNILSWLVCRVSFPWDDLLLMDIPPA